MGGRHILGSKISLRVHNIAHQRKPEVGSSVYALCYATFSAPLMIKTKEDTGKLLYAKQTTIMVLLLRGERVDPALLSEAGEGPWAHPWPDIPS